MYIYVRYVKKKKNGGRDKKNVNDKKINKVMCK